MRRGIGQIGAVLRIGSFVVIVAGSPVAPEGGRAGAPLAGLHAVLAADLSH
jgi:hypothetical protein